MRGQALIPLRRFTGGHFALHILLILLALGLSLHATAQQMLNDAHGKIAGRIVDSATGQPIAYATIILYRQGQTKILNGATADDKGKFSLDNIADGTYRIMIDFIGYKKLNKQNIVIGPKSPVIFLGNISIAESNASLKEVTITGQKSIIENRVDKTVFNVDRDVTSQGGVATDVLKKVPQVSVDADGNVEVQGNSNVRFLINGKPSTMFGNNVTDVLQTIPASQIQSIEVITSPGAKYDAEGTGGIINIVLKQSKAHGMNCSISGSAGSRLENGSINLTAREGNFGAHLSLSGNTNIPVNSPGSMTRYSTDPSAETHSTLLQNGLSKFLRQSYQGSGGVDWDISKDDNLSLNLSYFEFSHSGSGNTYQHLYTQDASGNTVQELYSILHNSNSFGSGGLDYSLSYNHKFKKEGQNLSFLYNSSYDKNTSDYTQTQSLYGQNLLYTGSKGNNPGTERETDISLDYSQPIGKWTTLETGTKATLRNINSITDVYSFDPLTQDYVYNSYQSNVLNYASNVYAAYVSGGFNVFNYLNVRAGLRYERTENKASFSNADNVSIPSYNTLAPSLLASKDLGNGQTIKFSYTYRIQRPQYRFLNPFKNASDPRNISTGDPTLKPEIAQKYEIGYNKGFNRGSNVYAGLFYESSNQDIKPYVTYYTKYPVGDSTYYNVAVTKYANIGLEEKTGLSLSGSVPFTRKLNVRGNIMVFDRYIINTIQPGNNNNGINFRINMNISYQIDSNLIAEAYGNWNSPNTNIQGKTPSWSSYTIAIRKQFWHKKASFGLTATNPFNSYYNMRTSTTGDNFQLYSLRQVPYQSFGITFTYKFGKLEFKKDKQRQQEMQDNGGDMGM
jgi:outer membrane receptor protein involved in Fe transport